MMQGPAPISILGDYAEDLLLAQFLQNEADEATYGNSRSAVVVPPLPPPLGEPTRSSPQQSAEDDVALALRFYEDEHLFQDAVQQHEDLMRFYQDEQLYQEAVRHHEELEADFAFAMQLQEDEQRLHRRVQQGEPEAVPCCTARCRRPPWNDVRGKACCRTCRASGGREHGPECNQNWLTQAGDKDGMTSPELDNLLLALQLQAKEEDEEDEVMSRRPAGFQPSGGKPQPTFAPGSQNGFDISLKGAVNDGMYPFSGSLPRCTIADVPPETDLWGAEADDLLMELRQRAENE